MYTLFPTKRYIKSLEKLVKNKRINKDTLDFILNELVEGKQLSAKYKDHKLSGDMQDFRDYHVHNDIVLIYQIRSRELVLIAFDIGTHSEIF